MEEKNNTPIITQQQEKCRGGKNLTGGVLVQLRERRGAGNGVTDTAFLKVSNALYLADSKGHFPGFVAQASQECWAWWPTLSLLRTPLPSPGVLPPSLALFLSAFAPPLLRQRSCSPSLGSLTISSSRLCPAHWTSPLASLPVSQCKVLKRELWLSPPHLFLHLVPPFTQLLKPQTWYSSLIFPFLSSSALHASANRNSSLPPKYFQPVYFSPSLPHPGLSHRLLSGQLQSLLNCFPIVTASCMEELVISNSLPETRSNMPLLKTICQLPTDCSSIGPCLAQLQILPSRPGALGPLPSPASAPA